MKNSILGKARWLREVALATSKNNGARVAQEWLKYAAMFVMLLTLGSGNAWGDTGTLVSNLSDISDGSTYYIAALNSSKYYTVPNTTISGQTFTCSEGSLSGSTLTPATGAGEFVFTAKTGTANAYYIYNTNLSKYLVATGSKTFGYVDSNSSDYGYWTFSTVSSGGFSGVFSVQHSSKTHYMRAYNNSVKCYDGASNNGVYLFEKGSACSGTKLGSPSEIDAVPSSSQVVLSWPVVANASSYTVTCKNTSSGASAGTVGSVTGDGPKTCTITGLSAGTSYTFSVIAKGDGTTWCDGDATEVVAIAGNSYSVTWMVNGASYKTTYLYTGGTKNLVFPTAPSSCDAEKVFVGWTETNIGSSETDTPPTLVTSATTISANKTYYAVFAKRGAFTRVTGPSSLAAGQELVIVSNKYSTAITTGIGYASAPTESSSTLTDATTTEAMVWLLTGGSSSGWFISNPSNGYVLGYASNPSSNNSTAATLAPNNTKSTWTIGQNSYTSNVLYISNKNTNSCALEASSASANWVVYNSSSYSSNQYCALKVYAATLTKFVTNCCTPLGSINGSVNLTTQNSATLQWDKLSNVDGTTPYTVSCKVTSSGSAAGSVGSIDLSGAKATCTITSLTGGIGYTFTITAHGASGYCDKEQVLTATTPTCTDWSTPTVSYSSSLAINSSEGVTISSGTTHGEVTYESSDEDVLTVDADGTIHAVGAGTAHITVTWAGDATYCEKSANSNDVTVSGIQVTGTTPVNFGQVYQNAVVADKTIAVTGLGLASAIIPSLPAGSPFSFSPASLAKDCSGATLTISASTATLGTYNQTLTLTSGAFSATVTVKMEVIAMPTATFTDALHNLTEDEDGVSLSSYNLTAAQGTPVVFPTLANQTKSAGTCEGEYYIFAGWTEGDNNTDPEAHLVTSHTLANGDAKHYYAVWADASGSATYTKLTSDAFKTSPTKYVLGGEDKGTKYFLYTYSSTDADLSWGECSSSEAPIQFTLSGTAGTLVAQDASGNYLAESSAKKKFRMSSTSATVQLQDDGTIETESFYLRYNHSSGFGGLRYYESESSEPAYFYEVSAGGTVHYRTSCCTNKVDAPVVTATAVTSTSITLTWPSDVKATGWQIEWNGAGGWVTPSGSCTHTVSGLTPNTTYTWRVRATYEDPVCGADVRSGSTTTNQVYHVTYAKGSGTGTCTAEGSTTDATGYEAGATVTLQSNGFSLSGHFFNAWTEDDPDVTISNNQFTMPDHDVVITASWTAKMDKYFDRMHDQTDALHGGVEETEGTNEGKYYIPKEGCNYSVPTAVDSNTGDACQTSHYKLQGWIAQSYVNANGEITDTSKIFSPTSRPTWTATGATYYAVWAEVTE